MPICTFAQKVGLVLSGGGASGLAHIGAIKALEQNNVPIDYIAGTSMGAFVACLYAIGYSPEQMEQLVESDDFYKSVNGIMDDNHTYYFKKKENNASWASVELKGLDWKNALPTNIINPVMGDFFLMALTAKAAAKANYNFDSLFIPFRCVASDVDTKQEVVFQSGDLGEAIRASMAFPFYFSPIFREGKVLFDGGLYNNFPIDIIQKEFSPDVIIGVNVADLYPTKFDEDNLVSQLRTMIVRKTNYTLKNGIIIEPNVDIDLFDFSNRQGIIDSGYKATVLKLKEIKKLVPQIFSPDNINKKRDNFLKNQPTLMVNEVHITGINSKQAEYVKKIIIPDDKPIDFKKLEARYFKLVGDDNIKKIFPKLLYNKETGYYKLLLDIRRKQNVVAQFGGNFASRPINQGFVGAQYNLWGKQSLSINANAYFGKLYSSGQIKARLDFPGKLPFYIEPEATINSWNFFKSSSTFFEDVKPSYLVETDQNYALNLGLPVKRKGKIILGGTLVRTNEDYYQTNQFSLKDTSDQTNFIGQTLFLDYERNTLNRKLYATSGTYLNIKFRYIDGDELSIPGSTAIKRDTSSKRHEWWQFKLVWDDYFKRQGHFRIGFYSELTISNQPFFNNYTASILATSAFQPLQEMKTLFLENFHTHNYAGIGLKNIISPFTGKIEFRLEGYMFQPYQEILRNDKSLAEYGLPFSKRYFIGTAGAVFNSPIGPASISVNYYYGNQKPFTILLHFGYIIFNKKALD